MSSVVTRELNRLGVAIANHAQPVHPAEQHLCTRAIRIVMARYPAFVRQTAYLVWQWMSRYPASIHFCQEGMVLANELDRLNAGLAYNKFEPQFQQWVSQASSLKRLHREVIALTMAEAMPEVSSDPLDNFDIVHFGIAAVVGLGHLYEKVLCPWVEQYGTPPDVPKLNMETTTEAFANWIGACIIASESCDQSILLARTPTGKAFDAVARLGYWIFTPEPPYPYRMSK